MHYSKWGDAARFANWLTNGQPTGAEGIGTTETGLIHAQRCNYRCGVARDYAECQCCLVIPHRE